MESLSVTGRRWQLTRADPAAVATLARRTGLPAVAAQCLLHRAGPDGSADWLRPGLGHLHDPYQMLGMELAVARVRQAAARGERVRIVTDYDVDGTSSSLILQRTLQLLGVAVDYHIPHRMDEGYGFSVRAARAAADDGVGLVLTADIGVRDHAAVAEAAARGVDVIICDHHLPSGEAVPDRAFAVLCPPQAGCPYPNKALAACGVSLKLASALLADHKKRDAILASMLKIAAIGTVADVVDLSTLENRAIVALGLDELRRPPHAPGLQALMEVAGLPEGPLDASDLGFRLGPRINAAGRLAEATAVIELFASKDLTDARERAKGLDRLNAQRQTLQERLITLSMQQVGDPPPAFLVLHGAEDEGWHRGVVGVVAAKVRDRLHRPVAVIAVAGDEARGSVRSTPEIHAVDALDAARDLLVRWGGHPVAAGFTVRTEAIPALAARLADFAAASPQRGAPTLALDGAVTTSELDRAGIEALQRLGPHGKGNPAPVLRLDTLAPPRLSPLGDRHLKLQIGGLEAVWWGGAVYADTLRGPVSLAGTPGMHQWQGRRQIRFTVEDARPAL